jgi:hypothetical protein
MPIDHETTAIAEYFTRVWGAQEIWLADHSVPIGDIPQGKRYLPKQEWKKGEYYDKKR